MIARPSQIEFGLFIVAATIIVVVLLLRYRRLRRRVGPRRESPIAPPASTVAQPGARTRRQVAALPVRFGPQGELEVLIVSTRGSGRWTVPKGWPMRGRSDAEAAAQEAYEEAGVRGIVATEPLGSFEYVKRRNDDETLFVAVYQLNVTSNVRHWRERGQRKQRWLTPSAAADCVAWPGLADVIRSVERSRTP